VGDKQPSTRPGVSPNDSSPGPTSPSGRVGRAFAIISAVGPLFYVALVVVLGLLWGGYDPIRQTQSELGAVDSPYGDLMNVAVFMGLGLTILAFAAAYHLLLNGSWAKTLATVLLVLGGLGMVVVGFFPCDAGCVDVTRTSELHSIFSMPGAIGLPAAAMFSSLAFRVDGRFSVAWQTVSFWLGLLTLASGPVIAAEVAGDAGGALQRAAMWAPLLWTSAVSWKLRSPVMSTEG
jgi:hypothetical membrane protein